MKSDSALWPLTEPGDSAQTESRLQAAKKAKSVFDEFYQLEGYNCWPHLASRSVAGRENAIEVESTSGCKAACQREKECEGFIVGLAGNSSRCWLRGRVDISQCSRVANREHGDWDFWLKVSQGSANKTEAPEHTFYMYRAAADGMMGKYPFGEINAANMDGVVWYLMNEIVTNYSHGVRCPRRFNISKIHRFKVRTKASAELFAQKMDFGVRFAYDEGRCAGRCFSGNMCTGEGDCAAQYDRYGFVVGCNRFIDQYPFPAGYISAPGGIWYSLPIGGRCFGNVTGDKHCTWSYEYAGEVTVEELERVASGKDNCCDDHCTDFWHDPYNVATMSWRVRKALDLFSKKYPEMPADLSTPPCDFDWHRWYEQDAWAQHDPWH